jgi:hypothetical protein
MRFNVFSVQKLEDGRFLLLAICEKGQVWQSIGELNPESVLEAGAWIQVKFEPCEAPKKHPNTNPGQVLQFPTRTKS